jgi:hypothetical protein
MNNAIWALPVSQNFEWRSQVLIKRTKSYKKIDQKSEKLVNLNGWKNSSENEHSKLEKVKNR